MEIASVMSQLILQFLIYFFNLMVNIVFIKIDLSVSFRLSMDDKINGNPIGWLQELCMARRWPPPHYETELEVGLPHERQFTIACVVAKYRETG